MGLIPQEVQRPTRDAIGLHKRYQRLCGALIAARHEADLTQIDLAKKLRRPQSYVSKYERGERRLDVVEFIEVAEALKVQPARVIDEVRG